jgi:DNA adenine methylase
MRTLVPPIKSQGIKTKLVPWIMDVARRANIGECDTNARWIEPFLGTGVVAFNSGSHRALLGDSNPHVINFYRGIQDGSISPASTRRYLEEEGETLLHADENGYAHYRFIRDRFNETHSPLDFLFLSRAGFNGMMRFGKKGNWNIPFCKKPNRFSKSYITKIVNQIAAVRAAIGDDWVFMNANFSDIIEQAKAGDIIYADPPYFGRYVDYYNGWTEEEEHTLFMLLSRTKARFILSTWHHNDWRENDMVKKYWSQFKVVTKDHFYHSGGKIENRRTIVEALVCNFALDAIAQHNHGSIEHAKAEQLQMAV